MDRALLFCDGCYNIPNIKNIGKICKTNMPSNTAFRGFGGPQVNFYYFIINNVTPFLFKGHLFTEAWIDHVAHVLKIPTEKVREINMYNEGDLTYYGSPVTKNIRKAWEECKKTSEFEKRKLEVEKFNK